jgi:hypothetical protein
MRNVFGWSLPPGVTNRMIEESSGEGPCAVCGQSVDECICPECSVCQSIGDPACYENHALLRTPEQIAMRAEADAKIEAENAAFEQMYVDPTLDGHDA